MLLSRYSCNRYKVTIDIHCIKFTSIHIQYPIGVILCIKENMVMRLREIITVFN